MQICDALMLSRTAIFDRDEFQTTKQPKAQVARQNPELNKNVASTTLGEIQLNTQHVEFDSPSHFAAKACL